MKQGRAFSAKNGSTPASFQSAQGTFSLMQVQCLVATFNLCIAALAHLMKSKGASSPVHDIRVGNRFYAEVQRVEKSTA